jgi:hypothetical protein
VMIHAAHGGGIVAADDGAALDADYAATGLSQEERDALWALAPGSGVAPVLVRDHVLAAAAPPPLPSGDKVEGGDLHGVAARTPVALPPRLLRVWPAGAKTLDVQDPATADDAKRFLDTPRLEITVSRTIADAATKDTGTWVHAYLASRDGQIFGFTAIPASTTDVATADGSTEQTITIGLDQATFRGGQRELLIVMRPDAAPAGQAPVGVADPQELLDADFAGTSLDADTVMAILDGNLSLTNHIDSLGAAGTDGATLFDGTPGGLVHYSFTVRGLPT